MKRPLTILLSVMMLVSPAVSATAEAPNKWPANKTWVMMVGVLDQKNPNVYANMATDDRKDQVLYDILIERGVPREQAVFLKDKDATLENIRKTFSALLKKTKKGDFLVFFFDGHGTVDKKGKGYFVNYDAPGRGYKGLWRIADVFKQIEDEFQGDSVLMLADCCHAGTMNEELKTLETRKGYACLASARKTVTSPDLWTFTESLIAGFEGRSYVDANRDGEISLNELKDDCWMDMVWFYTQETCFSRNRNFPGNLALVKADKRKHEDVGKYFEIKPGKKDRWHRARAVAHEDGSLTFCYYPDEWLRHVTIKADSENIRPIIRKCFSLDDVIDVRWHGRWHPAKTLKIDKERGLHRVR